MEKEKLAAYLKIIYFDEYKGIVDLSGLDFGDCSVDISHMKVNGNLYQEDQNVKGSLFQGSQNVSEDLFQSGSVAGCDLFQRRQDVGGRLLQDEQIVNGDLYQDEQYVGGVMYQDNLKEMTQKEIEKELGYKIKIKDRG